MASKQEKWQQIADRGIQDRFDPATRAKFDEAVNRGLITLSDVQAEDSPTNLQAVKPPQSQEQLRAQYLADLAAKQSPLEAGLIAAGRGLTTIGRGLGLAEPEDPVVTQGFQALQEESPISTTIGEVAGEAAPFLLPGGAIAKVATIPGRIAAAGALGASEGGLITKGKGGDAIETLQGGGIGGAIAGSLELALPVIGRIGGKIFRNVMGKSPSAPLLNAQGQPTEELLDALDKAGVSFDDLQGEASRLIDIDDVDDAASLARKSFLEDQGIIPTRAQVTGDASTFQSQQELAKTSGRVRRALEGQESALANKFEHAVTATGGSANASRSSVIDRIADRSIDLDSQISDAYKAAREIAPTGKVVSLDRTASLASRLKDFETSTGGLPSSVTGLLKNRGLIDPSGRLITSNRQAARDILKLKAEAKKLGMRVTDDNRIVNALGQVDKNMTEDLLALNLKDKGRQLTVNEAEALRVDFNSLFDSLTPLGKRKLADVKNALDLDVEKAVGQDVFAAPRAGKAKFEEDLKRAQVNKFDARKKNLVRDILENKVNPDRFLNDAVLSKTIRSDDLNQLKNFLHLDDSVEGAAAWNDLRAEAMEHIKSFAIKEVAGDPALSRSGIEKAMKSIGTDKLKVLFSGEERKFLSDMLKVSKLREPVRGTAMGKGPSAQAIQSLSRGISRIPLLNSVFGGAAELVSSDVAGRSILRQPTIAPSLKPVKGTLAAPAAIPLFTNTGE